ncbi:Hypothetical predicted protein [Paramuricea clavata]|uniref:Uncharacterized protein n=1 Tax=Paramuricea clavata TaxID=317549 RepID=A0A6S7GRR1_PARCT|nr:Hypothetical predicted protein [Paramuricea clavata]
MHLVSSCYYFSTYKTIWSKARAACQKLGGDLAVPTNNKENVAIWNIAKQKSLSHPWIGLVRHKDTKFYTVQGIKVSYTNWSPGEPNNHKTENCVHLLINTNGHWNDHGCPWNYNFICQQSSIKRK